MNLWCDTHRRSHNFPPSAVERIFYAMQAMLAETEANGPLPFSGEPQLVCPEEALRSAGSVEAYREHVDALRERRLASERSRRAQLRGRST